METNLILEERLPRVFMHRYLRLTLIGFGACAPVSLLLWFLGQIDGWPSWSPQQGCHELIYYSVGGAYLPACSVFLSDLFSEQIEERNERTRSLLIFLAGASLGLLLLGWTAICSATGLDFLNDRRFIELLGVAPKQAQSLVAKAEFLSYCKILIENCGQYICLFGALTLANSWLYDLLEELSVSSKMLFPLRFLIPSLIVFRIIVLYARQMVPAGAPEFMQLITPCICVGITMVVTFIWSTNIVTTLARLCRL